MAFSQNGWPVLQQYGGPLVSNTIPGTGLHFLGGVLGGDVDLVLRYVAARWHREVEPIVGPADKTGLWGYNYRPIRGQSSGFSNHASGTAVDINSAKHPLGTKTLTSAQKAALKRIESDLDGVVRFGAFYSGRPDEMHAEADGSAAALARVATRIRNGQVPNVPNEMLANDIPKKPTPLPPLPLPPVVPDPDPPTPEEDEMVRLMKLAGDPRRLCADFGGHTFWHVTSQDQYDWMRDALGISELQGDQAPWTLEGFVDISGK